MSRLRDINVVKVNGNYGITFNGPNIMMPSGAPFAVKSKKLAELCAGEWSAQGVAVQPDTMPIVRLANVALDRTSISREDMVALIVKHAANDLVCQRVETPELLVRRQAATWDPLLRWSKSRLKFEPMVGIGPATPKNDAAPIAEAARKLDDYRLAALGQAAALAESAIIGFALVLGHLTGRAAFEAALLNRLYQLEGGAADAEDRRKFEHLAREFEAVQLFVEAL